MFLNFCLVKTNFERFPLSGGKWWAGKYKIPAPTGILYSTCSVFNPLQEIAMQFDFLWTRGKVQVAVKISARFILALIMLFSQ